MGSEVNEPLEASLQTFRLVALPKLGKRRGNPAAAPARDQGRERDLRDQEEERAWRRCRSRRQALPEPSKWLPATMIPEGNSEVYLKLSGKWANIGGKLLKVRPMQPESSDPQTGIPGGHQAVSSWYEKGELGMCPECGQQTLLPPDEMAEPATICLSCGALSISRKEVPRSGL